MLDDLGDLNLAQVQAVVAHRVLKFNRGQGAVTVAIHGLEHASKAAQAISTSLLAEVDYFSLNFFEIADLHMLLHIWVSNVQVTALSSSKIYCGLLLFKVNVAFIADNSFGLVQRLSKT